MITQCMPPTMSVKEYGKIHGVGHMAAYNWVREGFLPEAALLTGGRSIRLRPLVLAQWYGGPIEPGEIVYIDVVCDILDVKPTMMRNRIRAGKYPVGLFKIYKGKIYIAQTALSEFLATGKILPQVDEADHFALNRMLEKSRKLSEARKEVMREVQKAKEVSRRERRKDTIRKLLDPDEV